MKFKVWNYQDLKGVWEISIKIDGVRCHNIDGVYKSRKDKILHNIPKTKQFEVAEIYCGSFKSTIENTRTFLTEKEILEDHIYPLHPVLDERLYITTVENPTMGYIMDLFDVYHNELGHEGLILKQGDIRLKVKNRETYDVVVTGTYPGKGKYTGLLGGFITNLGRVGSGLTDEQRKEYNTEDIIGQTIEVDCMEMTPDGKFRHPRFVRVREDK